MKKLIIVVITAVFMSACSSSPEDKLQDRLNKLEDIQLEATDRRKQREQTQREL